MFLPIPKYCPKRSYRYRWLIGDEVPIWDEEEDPLPYVRLNTPRLISGSSNQKPFLVFQVETKMLRFKIE